MQLQEEFPSGTLKAFLQLQLHDLTALGFKWKDFENNGMCFVVRWFFALPMLLLLFYATGSATTG